MSNRVTVTVSRPRSISVNAQQSQPVTIASIGSIGFTKIDNIVDLDLSGKSDGSVILYDGSTQRWTTSKILNKQTVEAGEF